MTPRTLALSLIAAGLIAPAGCGSGGLGTCDALAELNAAEGERPALIAAEEDAARADDPQAISAAADAREEAEGRRVAALDALDDAVGRDAELLGALSGLRADWIGRPGVDPQATVDALAAVNAAYNTTCG